MNPLKQIIFSATILLIASQIALPLEKTELKLAEVPLTLDQAVTTAIESNRQLQQAGHDFIAAERKISETRSMFEFKLSADGSWQRVHDSSSFAMATYPPADISGYFATSALVVPQGTPIYVANPQPNIITRPLSAQQTRSLDLTLSKPLLTFGKKRDSIRLRRRERDVQSLEVRRTELDVILKTKDAFFNYLLAKRSAEVMEKTLKLEEEHLDAAKKREEQGTIPHFDVIRAEVGVATAKENLNRVETGRDLARMTLNNVLGLPVERPTNVSFDTGNIAMPELAPVEDYIQAALKNRAELGQLGLAVEQAGIGARLTKNKPTVAFALLYNLISSGSAFSSENTFRYVVSYQADIIDSGVAHAKIAQAKQTVEKLKLQKTDLREGVILQTHQSYLNLIEAGKRLDTSRAIMNQATTAREMADIGHEQGVTSEIDWKDALHGEVQAGLNLAQAEYDLEMAKARLANAIGKSEFDDLDSENQ
ncbi:MAG: TolC family protein [bacterium]